jgi:tetratricopeptide (TPR) repeat protein
MAGNRAIFERALEQGRAAAQREDWATALKEVLRAVQEIPNDLDARSQLAVALYHNAKYAQAIQLLEDLRKRRGDDPFTLAYLARSYEGNEDLDKAGKILVTLAEQSLAQHIIPDALEALEEAVRLQPQDTDLRIRLAEILVEAGDSRRAAEQCVEIARLRHTAGDIPGTEEAVDEALSLDSANRAAQALKAELGMQRTSAPAAEPIAQSPVAPEQDNGDYPWMASGADTTTADTDDYPWTTGATPTSESDSGNYPWTTPTMHTGALRDPQLALEQLLGQASAAREAGNNAAALQMYEQAVQQGAERNDMFFTLGMLYQERGDHANAVTMLRKAAASDDFALSAHFALGDSLKAQGELQAAAEEYETTIRCVDLETIGRAEVDDLIAMYRAAAECYVELGELSRAASLYGTLAGFLQSKRWLKDLAEEFKARAKDLTERSMFAKLRTLGTGTLPVERVIAPDPEPEPTQTTWGSLPSFSDFLRGDATQAPAAPVDPFAAMASLSVPEQIFAPVTVIDTSGCDDTIARFIESSGRFIEQGLVWAAIDACHEIIRHNTEYLPVHLRLGEIYEREGRIEDALLKYRTLIDTYTVRGRELEAVDVYFRVIELSPESMDKRLQLVELLRKAKRSEAAVEQALIVANTYFRLGQTNKALEEYRRIQSWAPATPKLHQEYGQALLKLERWEAAQSEFRRAVQLDPQNPVALAQLNLTMAVLGQNEQAMWDSFAALKAKLVADATHHPAVQSEYRSALLIVETPILHYLLGLLQQSAQQHASAMMSFEQAVSLLVMEERPQLSPILVHQAMVDSYLEQGQIQEAIDQLHTVQRLFVEQPLHIVSMHHFARPLTESELQRKLAKALTGAGQWEAAIKALKICQQFDAAEPSSYMQLAEVYTHMGDNAAALQQYEQLATMQESKQQLDGAIATLDQAVQIASDALPLRSRLAQMLIRRGLLDRGLKELEEVASLQRAAGQIKEAVASLQQAAEVYWMLGQHDRVYHLYDKIVAFAPEDIDARQQLVNLHILSGRRDAAIAEQRRIARICSDQKNFTEAIGCYHQIIALDPADADAYESLGDMLMRQKEYDQAVRLYKRLARLRPNDERVEALQSAAERMLVMTNAAE